LGGGIDGQLAGLAVRTVMAHSSSANCMVALRRTAVVRRGCAPAQCIATNVKK
jgi:hypothetical protein